MKTTILLITLATSLALSQTTINGGRTILGPWDASGATTTKPVKTATADPGTCAVGELLYRTDTATLKHCSATNTWTDVGGTYTLPTASAGTLGGVKVGSGLTITDGVLAASGGSITCDPFTRTNFCLVEDFAFGTSTAGQIGTNGFNFTAIASGTGAPASPVTISAPNHLGIFKITSTTSANSGGNLRIGNTVTGWIQYPDLQDKEWEAVWIAKIDSTSDTRARIGFSSTASNLAPASGEFTFGFRYDTDATFADNSKNSGNGSWVVQMCAWSTGNCSTDTSGVYHVTNIAPDTNWHTFRIYRSGTTVYFQIDSNTASTMCASGCDMTTPSITSPASYGPLPSVLFGISSTTQRNIYVDYFSFKMAGISR